ncbi:MAG TPA: hypothetical protein EYQ18_09575 [Candidatus Handelsmanbacteria bacterium]|nr:hypothetical protein [Candidatus Handelsmanbacteria bacterium]
MKKVKLALICLLLGAFSSHAGEALVTKVRGSSLTIDTGAEAGMVQGMVVTIVRPPGEAVIHPITGENLGAPEVEIGTGEISKTANRAANVRIGPGLLLPVRPGDIVRFVTSDEEMIMDQERSIAREDKDAQEHQGFSKEISQLTRNIRNVQGRIGGIEKMMKRVERVEEGLKVQLRGINTDMNTMKDDIKDLKESVALMGTIPIDGLDENGESMGGGLDLESEEDVEALKQVVREVLESEQFTSDLSPLEEEELALPAEDGMEMEMEEDLEESEEEEEGSFFTSSLFFGILGAIGLVAVAAFFYLKMMAGSEDDDDEEHEDDEEIEEDDDDLDMDMEIEEEDDIVVEETS